MRSGILYNVALALVGVGYVVLLVALSTDSGPARIGGVTERRAAQLSTLPSVNSGYQQGLTPDGKPSADCDAEPPAWVCSVSGFRNATGQKCAVKMRVDTTVRRPLATAAGLVCGDLAEPAG